MSELPYYAWGDLAAILGPTLIALGLIWLVGKLRERSRRKRLARQPRRIAGYCRICHVVHEHTPTT